MANKRGPKSPMTAEHKAALAVGRTEGKAVRDYLEALRANKPKRGRPRKIETIKERLVEIAVELELGEVTPLEELWLIQEQMNLLAELEERTEGTDIGPLEAEFVRYAKNYSVRHGISYAAWRAVGVDPAILQKAGISR